MPLALVPPSDPITQESITRESIIAGTPPNSLTRKIRLALFDLGIGRYGIGFPYVLWLKNKK
jgi:hypothetical protein